MDAYVGMNLFKQVFNDYLKDKTFIISTHALQYLSFFDRIFYMNQGKIAWEGTYNEIIHESFYSEFVKQLERKKSDSEKKKSEKSKGKINEEKNSSKKEVVKLTKLDDDKDKDKMSLQSFLAFINYSGGIIQIVKIISVNIIWKTSQICSNYYLTSWSSKKNISTQENIYSLIIFVLITLPSIIFVHLRHVFMQDAYLTYSKKMHETLVNKLIGAPINLFHDITPKGHIITRLGKDLDSSARLNNNLSGTSRLFFHLIGSIIVCILFNIWSLPIILIIMIIEIAFTFYCLNPIRDMNKLEGTYRTPLYGVFTESLSGLHIIRAYKYEKQFMEKYQNKMNDYIKICLYQSGINGWFSVHLDMMSCIILIFILVFSYLFKEKYDSQSMGLLLTYSISIIDYSFHFMERFSRLNKLLVSVERCYNYTNIVQEKSLISDNVNSKNNLLFSNEKNYITNGKINFIDYSVKYRPNTPLVLKNLTFEISPKQKIGVVGRTGSGKSTLCLCIFRILEANSGKILIDDYDISKICLENLRKNLTIIPQDPTLIEGTVRENIDPSNSSNDSEINKMIKEVGLEDFMYDKNLDYIITENGSNISIGEKQLICVARALLKKSKIIIMDEATANIDYKTETVLQNSINQGMKDSTVITIAHRIKTIINYDKILVLNNGQMVEFDSPKNLIEKKGLFYQLYKESSLEK